MRVGILNAPLFIVTILQKSSVNGIYCRYTKVLTMVDSIPKKEERNVANILLKCGECRYLLFRYTYTNI